MAQNNIIPTQKINDAAGTNQALREVLQSMVQTSTLQSIASNTAAGADVPAQAKGTVSYLEKSYIVQIQNPGSTSATSALQNAQAAAGATASDVTANVRAIYHQIRVATAPTFSIASGVQTFGGDTGSTQTYWTLTGLGSGRFYFQVRSSYDGTNWNLWRNANGGQTITKGVEGVTTEAVTNAVWAQFTLPGDQLVAFGSGFCADGQGFDVATNLYSSALQAIPGPNGFQTTADLSSGIRANSIAIAAPTAPGPLTGPADYPIQLSENYEDGADGDADQWPGSANIFGFGYDPLGSNVSYYTNATGSWVVHTLPGGAQMAVGAGTVANGTNLQIPPEMAWFQAANMLGLCTPARAFSNSHHAHGVNHAGFTGTQVNATFQDGEGHVWGNTVNWFAVAFSAGVNFQAVSNGRFVLFTLPSGTPVAIGTGVVPSGQSFGLPPGFTEKQTVSIGVPVTFNDSGHAMAGVAHCSITGTAARLQYQDGAQNFWDGNVGWFCFAWQ